MSLKEELRLKQLAQLLLFPPKVANAYANARRAAAAKRPGWTRPNGDAARAVCRGDVDGLHDAMVRGADPNHSSKSRGIMGSYSLLEKAASIGNVDCCALLVAAGADVNFIADSEAPLHGGCWKGHAAVVSFLLKSGADVDCRDKDGQTPLHIACALGHAAVASLLLAAGADTNQRDYVLADWNRRDFVRRTPFDRALHLGHRGCVLALLRAGAEIQVIPPWELRKLSHWRGACKVERGLNAKRESYAFNSRVKPLHDYLVRIRDAGGWKAHVARHRALLVGRLRILLRRSSTTRSASSARWSGPTDENDVGMKAFFAKQMSTMLAKQAEEYLAHANMWAKAAGIPPTLTIGGEPQPLKRKRGVKKEVAPPSSRSRRTSATASARTCRLPDEALGLIVDFSAPAGGN